MFQGEFDFGVPQFRLVLQPALIAGAAGVALIAARLWVGKGGAVAAAGFFLVVHGAISVAVGVGWDEVTPHFPLYLGSALLVEVVAAVLGTRRPLLFGVVAGAVIGTLGTATEALWSQVFMPLPWGSDMAVEGTLMALVTGVAGAVIGVLLALGLEGRLTALPRARLLYLASLAAVALVVTNGLIATVPRGADVDVALTEAGERGGVRYVDAEVTIPPGVVDDPSWVQVTAWQGDGLVVSPARADDRGHLAQHRAVPGERPRLEDAAAHPGRPEHDRAADLPAGRCRPRRRGGGRPGRLHPAARSGDRDPAARAQPQRSGLAVRGRQPGGPRVLAGAGRCPGLGRQPRLPWWTPPRTAAGHPHPVALTHHPAGDVTGYATLLAHHSLVQALPALVPMVLLVGVFAAIVLADRRRGRRSRQKGSGTAPDRTDAEQQTPGRPQA